MLGGQQSSWLHTTGVLRLPDKKSKHKAVIEKAVDTLKEKKKKSTEIVTEVSKVHGILVKIHACVCMCLSMFEEWRDKICMTV